MITIAKSFLRFLIIANALEGFENLYETPQRFRGILFDLASAQLKRTII